MCEKQPVSTLLKYILKILPLELRMALFSMLHLFTPELWLNNKLFTNVFCSGSYLIKVESYQLRNVFAFSDLSHLK